MKRNPAWHIHINNIYILSYPKFFVLLHFESSTINVEAIAGRTGKLSIIGTGSSYHQ